MSEQTTQQQTATPATPPEATPAQPAEKTFTQAELDSIVGKRLAKAMKGMPAEEELTAFRAWKENQQTEQEKQEARVRELSEAKTALTAAQAELEQYRREKLLLGKGVPAGDVDYYAFKIGKLVTDTVDFEKAAEGYLKEHTPPKEQGVMRVDLGAPLGGTAKPMTKEDIFKRDEKGRYVLSTAERQKAIAEHHELFEP